MEEEESEGVGKDGVNGQEGALSLCDGKEG